MDKIIDCNGAIVSIFYKQSVVGNNTYPTYTKMGGTLPAFKNEIEDFFFTRLGTGRTLKCRPATVRLLIHIIGELIGV